MRLTIAAVALLIVPQIVLGQAEDPRLQLWLECVGGSKESCLSGAKQASKEKNFGTSLEMASKGCAQGSKESCEFQVLEVAKNGNFDGFLQAMSVACDGGAVQYCSMTASSRLGLFENTLRVADPELFEVWNKGAREEDLRKLNQSIAKNRRKAEMIALIKQCESGKVASCQKAGQYRFEEGNYGEALGFFETACDRKSAESCELAGLSAQKLNQGDYAITLVGIACKLGRLSSCRLQGKIAQELKNSEKVAAEQRSAELEKSRQVEHERHAQSIRNARARAEQYEMQRRDAEMMKAAKQVGEAIATGGRKKKRVCRTVANYAGDGIETVCDDEYR